MAPNLLNGRSIRSATYRTSSERNGAAKDGQDNGLLSTIHEKQRSIAIATSFNE